jgi:hypothetical protein
MPKYAEQGQHPEVIEIWGLGPQAVQVTVQDDNGDTRVFRIYALERIRGDGTFFGHTDELVESGGLGVWMDITAQISHAMACATADEAIDEELGWVTEYVRKSARSTRP